MYLDIAIIAIILVSTIIGLFRGITREVFSILGIFFGVLGASRFYPKASSIIFKNTPISNQTLTDLCGFVAVFFVIVVAFLVASMILCKIWRILLLGWVDRIGGAIFGLVRGILLIGLLSILLSLFPIKQTEELIKGSFLLQFFEPFKTFILSLFPFSESFMR